MRDKNNIYTYYMYSEIRFFLIKLIKLFKN